MGIRHSGLISAMSVPRRRALLSGRPAPRRGGVGLRMSNFGAASQAVRAARFSAVRISPASLWIYGQATVRHDDLSGHIARLLRSEEQDHLRDIVGLANAAERNASRRLLDARRTERMLF